MEDTRREQVKALEADRTALERVPEVFGHVQYLVGNVGHGVQEMTKTLKLLDSPVAELQQSLSEAISMLTAALSDARAKGCEPHLVSTLEGILAAPLTKATKACSKFRVCTDGRLDLTLGLAQQAAEEVRAC
jgi:hypothetical protein